MEESSKVKVKDKVNEKKREKRPSSRRLEDNEKEVSSEDSHEKRSKRRRYEKESSYEDRRKYSKRRDYDGDDFSPDENDRYWSRHSKEERDEKQYVTKERYWGGNPPRRKAEDEEDRVDEKGYLVGSRYYTDPPRKRKEGESKVPKSSENEVNNLDQPPPKAPKKNDDVITSRTGGAYIPPAKLRLMQASITDKSSAEYQRIAWEALKKSIHGHINKVNTSNIGVVARLLFKENIIRGRGLLCRSIVQAQSASVTFTNVYASLVSIINSKFPNIGELLLKRVIVRFKRAYKRNDKAVCISSATFIAHLINQRVAHEILGLELVTLLVENPTNDSIEVAVAFLKEAGQKLSEVSSKGTNAIFDMLRNILHEGKLEKRVQYMIEVMFQVRKDDFATFPAVPEELDLVDEEDQFTHLIGLDDAVDTQDILNVFKLDSEYQANEDRYKELRSEILDTESEGSGSGESSSGEEGSDEEDEEEEEKKTLIIDNTETNLVAFRKTIYLTIQSSLDFEECAHKLLKMEIKPGQEKELCHMFLDCCAEQRTYEKFFGLLSQRFCQVNKIYIAPFEQIFSDTYATVHRLDTNRLRNVAKLFAHLLFTDAISWAVLSTIKLNEEDTTSSSRIFIKILFQELSEYMGLSNLNARLKDPTLQTAMEGLFPRDNPKNTRFAINFFTSIGLGGLTDELREHLKNLPKPVPVSQLIQELSSTSSSSSSEESSSESSSSSSSEEETPKKHKKNNNSKKKSERSGDGGRENDRAQNSRGRRNKHEQAMEEQQDRRDKHRNDFIDMRNKRDPNEKEIRHFGGEIEQYKERSEEFKARDGRKHREDRYDSKHSNRKGDIDREFRQPTHRQDEEENGRGVRRPKHRQGEEENEREVRRPKHRQDEEENEREVRRPKHRQDEEENGRGIRRPKHRQDEKENEREVRRPKHRQDEEENEREVRRPKHRQDEKENEREVRLPKHRQDEKENEREVRLPKHRQDEKENEREIRRPKHRQHEEEDEREVRRPKHRQDEEENEREVRRPKHRQDEEENGRGIRRPKHRQDEEENEREVRRPKHRQHEEEDEREARRPKNRQGEEENEREVRRPKHRQDEEENKREIRRPKHRQGEEENEREVRRPKHRQDEESKDKEKRYRQKINS